MAVKALHELLGLRPDHLPSLQPLARAADQAQDRAGALRAYRRLAALARDPVEAAEAHVQLARLCALTEDDIAGARLHCEAALKLAPDLPPALYLLGELCHRAGEHLRALKALDRLRDVALAGTSSTASAAPTCCAGQVWEIGLKQLENALLRYREAVSLLPGEPEPLVAQARVAEGLGRVAGGGRRLPAGVELAGPSPTDAASGAPRTPPTTPWRAVPPALRRPVQAREHLEAALALEPDDATPSRSSARPSAPPGTRAELADALEKAAPPFHDPLRRRRLLGRGGRAVPRPAGRSRRRPSASSSAPSTRIRATASRSRACSRSPRPSRRSAARAAACER